MTEKKSDAKMKKYLRKREKMTKRGERTGKGEGGQMMEEDFEKRDDKQEKTTTERRVKE